MKLSQPGELRVRGYLFILHRSLSTFMPAEVAKDAVREVESHILERMALANPASDEKEALERILDHLGTPMKVAQAYAAEITFDEAVATGRPLPILRALWLISTSVRGFFAALGLLIGYAAGAGFVLVALLKPIFPQNVGLILRDGVPTQLGAVSNIGPGVEVAGGYSIIPICLVAGGLILVGTNRMARAFLAWWRTRLKGPLVESLSGSSAASLP